jgi:hypothetical protein
VATGAALIVIVAAKFTEGAWITIFAIPCVILLLKAIKRYYTELEARLREKGPLELSGLTPPWVLVAMQDWTRLADKALRFAFRISPDVLAVHCRLGGPEEEQHKEEERRLRQRWTAEVERPARQAGLKPPGLVLMASPYRQIHTPLLKLIAELEAQSQDRLIAVLIPEVVKRRWWEHLMYSHRARQLRSALLRYGGSRLVVINIPWYLQEPEIDEALSEETEAAAEEKKAG